MLHASASGSTPVLPASYFVRDSEQITTSEALLIFQEEPKASKSSLLAETIPENDRPYRPSPVSATALDLCRPISFHQRRDFRP